MSSTDQLSSGVTIRRLSDQVDGSGMYETIVLKPDGTEREPWQLCHSKVSRSLLVFITILLFIIVADCFCIIKLLQKNTTCEENTVYCMILGSTVTILLPSPIVVPDQLLNHEQGGVHN